MDACEIVPALRSAAANREDGGDSGVRRGSRPEYLKCSAPCRTGEYNRRPRWRKLRTRGAVSMGAGQHND
jgi:hypothetical protein